MRQITKRQLDRQGSKVKIKEWMPFELIVDGEVVAQIVAMDWLAIDVLARSHELGSQVTKAKQIDSQASELRFSKARQIKGRMG